MYEKLVEPALRIFVEGPQGSRRATGDAKSLNSHISLLLIASAHPAMLFAFCSETSFDSGDF